ncbi:hypothetical protein B0H21DRAFT_716557 [Amylocystis lapponica]|nr:hypothetical protein B0H21DRAFT_716557 [Amylocystis lapponica]
MSSLPRSSTSHLSIPQTSSLSATSSRTKSTTHPVPTPANLPSPPTVLRSRSHSAQSQSLSLPHTPLYSPQVSSTNVFQIASPKRLLMPMVRSARPGSPRISSSKPSSAKAPRSRAGSSSTTALASTEIPERVSPPAIPDWIGGGRKFEVVEEHLELEGYQIYAVEKWVVERRSVTVLTVFTGDPSHKITVTALSPCSNLNQKEAQSEWEQALKQLRREGARPKETDKGILMVTSLANFRSDYTIVHIPRGNFLDIREQLYTNINILRMGCSGRSALTLEEPSDTTKDRFISMYNVPDKASARSRELFNATVLELVKLVQSALVIFDMFDLQPEERNGLLCDVTCDGIKRWVTAIGEPCMKVEPMERVADPTVVSALFSLIMTIRNKLQVLGHAVPKDPFVDPQAFTKALTAFLSSKPHSHTHSHSHTLSLTPSPLPSVNASPNMSSVPSSTHTSPVAPAVFLTQLLIQFIQSAYNKKMRQNESYKVHRVLINKLDDLATDLRTTGADSSVGNNAASSVNPTTDLGAFVKVVVGSSKDAPQSLRYLWTGRPGEVGKKRREKEAVWSDAEREREEREREKEKEGERANGGKSVREKDGREVDRDKEKEKDVRSSEDEGDLTGGKPWSGRVQRKIESWAALGRTKKLSVDFGTLGKSAVSPESLSREGQSGQSSTVPSVIISRDPDDEGVTSSGRMSPASGSRTPHHQMANKESYPTADRSVSELSDYDRRVNEFNHKRPSARPSNPSRITSWSDPVSARGLLGEDTLGPRRATSPLGKVVDFEEEDEESESILQAERENKPHRRRINLGLHRRRSFDDAADLKDTRILPVERMRIDVDLCGQLLVLQRREAHLANVAACLEALAGSLSRTNSRLRQDHESARPHIDELHRRAEILHDLDFARSKADGLTQETNVLQYESAQFLVDELWHMAAQPRQRVFALREKAFGTGRRHPHGVRSPHGLFNRVQWTLDGRERLVDRFGRTESEAEEEEGLPLAAGMEIDAEFEEVDAVEHQTLKPTWLLRFFNYWGSKWGASRGKANDVKTQGGEEVEQEGDVSEETNVSTTSLPTQTVQPRLRTPMRNHTT